jgi:hypothetical protein
MMLHVLILGAELLVLRCYRDTWDKFGEWNYELSSLTHNEAQKLEVKGQLEFIKQALDNLLETWLCELRLEGLSTINGKEYYFTPEISTFFFEGIKLASLKYVFQKEKIIREFLLLTENGEVETNQMVDKGNFQMIDFLIDVKKFQIILDKDLSSFLNKEKNAKLIFIHNFNTHHEFDTSTRFFYPNVEGEFMKESNPELFRMAGILKCELIF